MTPLLLTNNPRMRPPLVSGLDVHLLDDDAPAVFLKARDRIHKGWRLANHPLYGNLQPHQQPYRSLLLLPPVSGSARDSRVDAPADPESLGFIEEALARQGGARPRGDFAARALGDCAFMDMELMRATVEACGGFMA